MIPTLLAAALASLVGTPHCLGMCGGFATASAQTPAGLWAWHLGRTGTYAALGAVAGTLGGALPGPAWVGALLSLALLVWFSAALAGWAPEPRFALPGLARLGGWAGRRTDLPARLLFGVVNGLLPCGLVYATLGLVVSTGHPAEGALAMLVFGLGTLPGLSAWAWGARRLLERYPSSRRWLAIAVLVAGVTGLSWRFGIGGG